MIMTTIMAIILLYLGPLHFTRRIKMNAMSALPVSPPIAFRSVFPNFNTVVTYNVLPIVIRDVH